MTRVALSWNELPAYGAALVRDGIRQLGSPVSVVATRPTIPILGMEEILGQPVNWIDPSGVTSWSQIGLEVPRVFFQAGWYIDSFIHLGREVRSHGGKVVLLADNCWKNSPRQWAGSVVFRAKLRRNVDAVWVPGASGARLMRWFGMPRDAIYQGLYGSDPARFDVGPLLSQRPKTFIYVGKLIETKGVVQLIEAFTRFRANHPDWSLAVFGDGPLRDRFQDVAGVTVNGFAQPPEVAAAMRSARFLVLPSWGDHWPLVANEAALCGCGLLLTSACGNISEFVGDENGRVYPPRSTGGLLSAFEWAASRSDRQLDAITEDSRRRGMRYTPANFAAEFGRIVSALR